MEDLETENEKSPNRRRGWGIGLGRMEGDAGEEKGPGLWLGVGMESQQLFFKCFFTYLTAPDLSCGRQDL